MQLLILHLEYAFYNALLHQATPTAQTLNVGQGGVVCRSTRTQSLTVVACVVLQCIPCFYECRCMSDGVFIKFVCQFLILW